MNNIVLEIQQALTAGYPIIYLQSPEEDRVHRFLSHIARQRSKEFPLITWTCTRGLQPQPKKGPSGDRDAVEVIYHLAENAPAGYYLMKDLMGLMESPSLVRAIKDAYYALQSTSDLAIFILGSDLEIPTSLEKHIFVIEIGPPGIDELAEMVEEFGAQTRNVKIPTDLLNDICYSLHGMALSEAQHIMRRALSMDKLTPRKIIEDIREAKKSMTSHARYLEYVPQQKEISDVAGLNYLKQWIMQRRDVFSRQSMDSGLPIPRGILIMGISGCGKSLSAKVVANAWNVPLFRLDMNLVFSDIYGNPEATFYRALKTIETVAPVVLWIDEIENGLGFSSDGSSIQSHIFSAFLTWMQEKPPLVFVAATANRIQSLPAEMIRKGRFDQVFFCDLPDDGERADLFDLHIRLNHGDPASIDIPSLISLTKGWNAAEIEQVIISARIDAARENRAFRTQDINHHSGDTVPLSKTMSEQIKLIRDWAWDRAMPASSGKGTELTLEEE